jgi:transcriptional regulator with XRE-family HTH domain
LLGWTKERLALESGAAPTTIVKFEAGKRNPQAATLTRIMETLAAAGVEFIAENGGGAGVRLRKAT